MNNFYNPPNLNSGNNNINAYSNNLYNISNDPNSINNSGDYYFDKNEMIRVQQILEQDKIQNKEKRQIVK